MKTRIGFVSNSSSCSFLIEVPAADIKAKKEATFSIKIELESATQYEGSIVADGTETDDELEEMAKDWLENTWFDERDHKKVEDVVAVLKKGHSLVECSLDRYTTLNLDNKSDEGYPMVGQRYE